MFVRLVTLATLVQCVVTYKNMQQKIPNGDCTPHPCKPGQVWEAVGHIIDEGSGTRNPFGRDFEAAGYQWTLDLCRKDSDGDGLHNGLELGDPYCTWKENNPPLTKEGISHPGICDPWDSPKCMEKSIASPKYSTQAMWLKDMCKADGLQCPALNDKDIKNVTVRLPAGTPVPGKQTTYECQIYDLYALGVAQGVDYHMVAVTPVVDNKAVVHHMVLFGCTDNTPATAQSYHCGFFPALTCQDFLHVWTIGLDGECYHPKSGVKIGKTGFKIVATQLHWNNAEKRSDLTDSSGLTLHYTPNLKLYDAGVFLVGSVLFYLPPQEKLVTVHSACSSGCTKQMFRGSINITSAWNHMHFTGNDMNIELRRNNVHMNYITYDTIYSYDSPQVQHFANPVEVFPGDTLVTMCAFRTLDRNQTTIWGDGTLDEMCFGFITYYPKQNMTAGYCVDKLGISDCDPGSLGGCFSVGRYLKMINTTEVYKEVSASCRMLSPCLKECVLTILRHMDTDPCMRGKIWEFIQTQLAESKGPGQEFLSRLASCKSEVAMASSTYLMRDVASDRRATPGLISLVISIIIMMHVMD